MEMQYAYLRAELHEASDKLIHFMNTMPLWHATCTKAWIPSLMRNRLFAPIVQDNMISTPAKRTFVLHVGAVIMVLGLLMSDRSTAQVTPSLGLRFSAGRPTLTLTGAVGTVYSIQYATGLSSANVWVDRTLLQAKGGGSVWADLSASTPGQRFYRAVSVPALAGTNLVFIQPGTFTMGSPTNEAGGFRLRRSIR
jgi:hypothetical protein